MMKSTFLRRLRFTALLLVLIFGTSGCVYYNTFYNARKNFNEAESQRKKAKGNTASINKAKYQTAIEKSEKVIEDHPTSNYYDDALYVVGVSSFYLGQYSKAERRFREILANYSNSEYATDAEVYLAKAKLLQDDVDAAMEGFQGIFDQDFKREYKAEAALALGDYHYENHRYDLARQFYTAVRDSLGNDLQKAAAQQAIADSRFDEYQSRDALVGYLQMLGMNPDKDQKYHALLRAAVCSYRLQRIDDGLDYLKTLMDDQVYFDSVGVLRLMVGEGYERDNDLEPAKATYDRILSEETRKDVTSEAAYRLALIYQYVEDDLVKAKEYYDKTSEFDRSSDIGQEALQASADIGKLSTYARTLKIDSTTTQAAIDGAAVTQYKLAELYWLKLNKPDSAILEMQYVVDSFPTSYDAPKALIALSQMVQQHYDDTAAADSILNLAVERYPSSDYMEEAVTILGLKGTPADTGYAKVYLDRAEHFTVDTLDVDSARYYYRIVVDRFPDSKYNLQARFALVWLDEQYDNPGDSTIYFAYQEITDSFPNTFWASAARDRVNAGGSKRSPQQGDSGGDTLFAEGDSLFADSLAAGQPGDTAAFVDEYTSIYTGPDGAEIPALPSDIKPVDIREEFEYPSEAYTSKWEGYLYFQIKLDFSGEVTDFVQKTRAPIEEINVRAARTVGSMTFNITDLDQRIQTSWLVYKYEVRLPDNIR